MTDENYVKFTPEEWAHAELEALAELGLTYAELKAQARVSDFTSLKHKQLWIIIGDSGASSPE